MSRPSKLTPEIVAEVAKQLPVCLYRETVAALLGISRSTFYDWLRRGARIRSGKADAAHPDAELLLAFSDAVKKGVAQGELRDLQTILDASAAAWQAAAWRLERRFPGRWGSNAREVRELAKKVDELLVRLAPKPAAGGEAG